MSTERGWRRWRTPAGIGLAVVVIAAAATFANVVLLGSTGEDRLGRLRPVDPVLSTTGGPAVTAPPETTTTVATPPATVTTTGTRTSAPTTAGTTTSAPTTTESGDDHDGSDSGRGRGRGRGDDDD